jgi:P2-related tail formation protein
MRVLDTLRHVVEALEVEVACLEAEQTNTGASPAKIGNQLRAVRQLMALLSNSNDAG